MRKLIEGLPGTEVVFDNFIVVGYGETVEEAKTMTGYLQNSLTDAEDANNYNSFQSKHVSASLLPSSVVNCKATRNKVYTYLKC